MHADHVWVNSEASTIRQSAPHSCLYGAIMNGHVLCFGASSSSIYMNNKKINLDQYNQPIKALKTGPLLRTTKNRIDIKLLSNIFLSFFNLFFAS
jgi:hypothetical protein